MGNETSNPYRLLPSVDEVLSRPDVAGLVPTAQRELLGEFLGALLDRWRAEIKAGELDGPGLLQRLERGDLLRALSAMVRGEEKSGLCRAVNAAGVVLHTGLGRAPVHPEAAEAMRQVAMGYGILEVDRESGARSRRDDRLSVLLSRLTGAEAGLAVNNNAAAVVLTLSAFAAGKETVVSRGELVEIGGSFRMPDVMERAGTKLVEAGTTNRTRPADFEAAHTPHTGLFLKVHTSNYRVVGFTEEIDAADLAGLGKRLGVPTAFDLGSGRLEHAGARPLDMLGDEPLVLAAVQSGVDVVMFSGDKLLGGPQAGLVVGSRQAIEHMRKNPLYRALRLDKVTIAGLERTLELVLEGRANEIPARRMMLLAPEEIRPVAERLAASVNALPGFAARVDDDRSQPGSGSAPGIFLPSVAVTVTDAPFSADELGRRLRLSDPPVFTRIHEDRVRLDPRTSLPGDLEDVEAVFRRLAAGA